MDNPLLVIGIGNSSRGDDGLGWAFLDAISQMQQLPAQLEYRYQLAVEDAELLTRFPRVLFADACETALSDGFSLEPCLPDAVAQLYTHQQTPGAILFLTQELYGHRPEAWCLRIQGYEWEFDMGLSEKGKENMERALGVFMEWLTAKNFSPATTPTPRAEKYPAPWLLLRP